VCGRERKRVGRSEMGMMLDDAADDEIDEYEIGK